jgi:hypothetical protein
MCRVESSLTLLRVVRGAEKLRSCCEVVGLQPRGRVNGYAAARGITGILRPMPGDNAPLTLVGTSKDR